MHRADSPDGGRLLNPPFIVPRRWEAETGYQAGQVVWYRGSYWRREPSEGNVRVSVAEEQTPDLAMHLWTPIHSTSDYSDSSPPTLSHRSTPSPSLHAPKPRRSTDATRPSIDNLTGDTRTDEDDSPDSQTTVRGVHDNHNQPGERLKAATGQSGASHGDGGEYDADEEDHSAASYFASKADEGLRFIVGKQERQKVSAGSASAAQDLKDEVGGDKVWRTGGVGIWSRDADEVVEKEKAKLWSEESKRLGREGWIEGARKRTAHYQSGTGVKPLIQWHLHLPNTPFPARAIPIGHEGGDGAPLYAARAWFRGGLHPGKAGPHLHAGASISYGGAEITLDTFEVLCAPGSGGAGGLLKWMMFRHGEHCGVEGWQPVEGGREESGEVLLIAKGDWERGQHPGKCRIGDDHAHVPWGGGEVWVRPFQVLAYANPTRR